MKTLPFYKDYFKIAYPLPKIDLIALADFAAGLILCSLPRTRICNSPAKIANVPHCSKRTRVITT